MRSFWARAAGALLLAAILIPGHPGDPVLAAAPDLHLASNRPASCPPPGSDSNTGTGTNSGPRGTFPWPAAPAGTDPARYELYDHTPVSDPPVRPANWDEAGATWKMTSARSADPRINQNPQELCGVKGGSVDRAWQVTTGRPTTVIAVLDSGIEWCHQGVVDKLYLNRAALPMPQRADGTSRTAGDAYDLNGDGVFNVEDYAQDPRIQRPYFCGEFISPEDLIRTFGAGDRVGPPGFKEAISGWNFVDNSNDAYDDVHYDHGTGEAGDSGGAANAAGQGVGSCPNCMILPIRVGDSFIASAQDFAQAVLFAVDSGASVIQEALGTLDQSDLAQQAIDYAVAHGVPVIASAADEEAGHHNQPGALQHTIVVNSVTKFPDLNGTPLYDPPSYLYLNGCTNYGANIAVSIESASCSSEAAGKGGGVAGLLVSAGQDALARGRLRAYPGQTTVSGGAMALSANEIQQLITMSADDVDFLTPAPPWGPPANYAVAAPLPTTRFPSQSGFDQYFGYGRLNAAAAVARVAAGQVPPEARLDSPRWFEPVPGNGTVTVAGMVGAVRTASFTYAVQVAAGPQPAEADFRTVATGSGTGRRMGTLATLSAVQLSALLPPALNPADRSNPDRDYLTIRLLVRDDGGRMGADRRALTLLRDASLVTGFPRRFDGSIDAAPVLAPIGPGGQNLLLVATTAGTVHALDPEGRELRGFPVHTAESDGWHRGEPAFTSGAVTAIPRSATLGGVAVGDLFHDGRQEIVLDDYSGRVYAWDLQGRMLRGFPVRTDARFSGPAARDSHNRLLRGIVGAPALADLEGTGRLDIVAGAMDRHLYAWRPDGSPVPGFPQLVVDRARVAGIDPVTDRVTFRPDAGVEQGSKIVDAPAIGALTGSGRPDIVIGTNEEYRGPVNASAVNTTTAALSQVPILNSANSRVYAFDAGGHLRPGWPAAVGDFEAGLLPVVGDGTTNSPALADVGGTGRLQVGVITTIGPAYVLNPDGTSYYGNGPDGKPIVLDLEGGSATANSPLYPSLPALGAPVFGNLGAGFGVSLVSPASSVGKALDAALPAQQQPNDVQVDAWNLTTRHFQPGFPSQVDDLEFLVQPLVANVGGPAAGAYVVTSSARGDIRALDALGREAAGFPKFTGGWVVNSPVVGAWGDLGRQVLVAGTREGYLFAWSTPAAPCDDPGPWPKGHHDLANTNNLQAAVVPQPARCRQ